MTAPGVVAGLLAVALTVVPAAAEELLVAAAVSMKDVVADVGRGLEQARPGVRVRYHLGASGELQRQIEAGAPADVFVSAASRPMDDLERRGLVQAGTRRVFAGNVLTVVVPRDSRLSLGTAADLLDPRVKRLVIGNPRTVPAGEYAAESLRALGVWEGLQGRLVLAENVRQALDYVARGEVEAGIVYATDVRVQADRVREAFRPPARAQPTIVYPVAVLGGARDPALARAFVDRLAGAEGRAALERFGFQPPGAR